MKNVKRVLYVDLIYAPRNAVDVFLVYTKAFTLLTVQIFTITAEIHARSLANFYRQYADRHMNFEIHATRRRVSRRERAIRQFVIVKNKLMSVCNASDLLLTMNFIIILSK